MRILALEPYYGGSHRAFLDGWASRSRHEWTLMTLPDTKWKWRMRHSAVTFARQAAQAIAEGQSWDIIFCSDMLNLAEFLGICHPLADTPAVVYFHENQLTYPDQNQKEWDYHFALTNMTSAITARHVYFNSSYHMNSFLDALAQFLRRMPDNNSLEEIEAIRSRSSVMYPCIDLPRIDRNKNAGTPHILWAARWEQDKNPALFFQALTVLKHSNNNFKLSVLGGGNARDILSVFEKAETDFAENIINWGYKDKRADYLEILSSADIAVSTADHEFFGISMVEAAAAGAFPLVPNRLAYPEVLDPSNMNPDFFYDGSIQSLTIRLQELVSKTAKGTLWNGDDQRGIKTVTRYSWDRNISSMDNEMERQMGNP